MGLAIASDLVEAMGGRLSVQSRRGEGSVFSFALNLSIVAPKTEGESRGEATLKNETAEGRISPQGGLRVLVAEDTPTNQKLISHVLQKRGHHVDIAATGEEAVAAVVQRPYDVILMDVQMPKMDGLQATAAIRALPGRERVPIIALTAHAMSGDRQRCLDAGMDHYLPKPLDIRKLVEVVEEFARQSVDSCEA